MLLDLSGRKIREGAKPLEQHIIAENLKRAVKEKYKNVDRNGAYMDNIQ